MFELNMELLLVKGKEKKFRKVIAVILSMVAVFALFSCVSMTAFATDSLSTAISKLDNQISSKQKEIDQLSSDLKWYQSHEDSTTGLDFISFCEVVKKDPLIVYSKGLSLSNTVSKGYIHIVGASVNSSHCSNLGLGIYYTGYLKSTGTSSYTYNGYTVWDYKPVEVKTYGSEISDIKEKLSKAKDDLQYLKAKKSNLMASKNAKYYFVSWRGSKVQIPNGAKTVKLNPGDEVNLQVVFKKNGSVEYPEEDFKWKSSNPKVVSVSVDGLVTIKVQKNGEAVITATGKTTGKKVQLKITTPKKEDIIPNSAKYYIISSKNSNNKIPYGTKSVELKPGSEVAIQVVYKNDGVQTKSVEEFTWSSSNSKIVSVTNDGAAKIKVLSNGEATITATGKTTGKKAQLKITAVTNPADSIVLSDGNLVMTCGSTRTLQPVLIPKDCNDDIYYLSTDTTVMKVTDDGVITAINPGTAYVIAITGSEKFALAQVEVTKGNSTELSEKYYAVEAVKQYYQGVDACLKAKPSYLGLYAYTVTKYPSKYVVTAIDFESFINQFIENKIKGNSDYKVSNCAKFEYSRTDQRITQKIINGYKFTGDIFRADSMTLDLSIYRDDEISHESGKQEITLEVNDSIFFDVNAEPFSFGEKALWTVSDETVLSPSNKSNYAFFLTALSQGVCEVTCTLEGGASYTCTITVE